MKRVDPAPSRVHTALVLVACLSAACLWSRLGLARLSTAHHHTFDLAEYTRLAWGLAHGQPWDSVMGGHMLGGHIPWVLAPLGVLGSLFGTAQTLIVAQAFALAFSGYAFFRLAARVVGEEAGVLLAVAYLAYPNLGHVATYEMHPGSFALWPMLVAFDALDRARAKRLVLACLAVLACRASFALEVICIALLAVLSDPVSHVSLETRARMRRVGVALGIGAALYLAMSMFYLRPTFGGLGGAVSGSLDAHFGKWGGSPFGIVAVLFSRPAEVFAHLCTPERLRYLPMVLAPLAFLPLLAPRALLVALPAIAINLASEFPTTTRIDSHYLTSAVPALAVAAMYGVAKLTRWPSLAGAHAPARALLALVTLAVSVLANVLAGGMPWSRDFVAEDFRPDTRTRAIAAILARIPEGASVQAPDVFLPRLAERSIVHRAPPPDRNTELVVLDLAHRRLYAQHEDLLRTRQEPVARAWLARPTLGLIARAGDYALLQRGVEPRAGLVRRYLFVRKRSQPVPTDAPLTRCLALRSAILAPDSVTIMLLAREPCPSDLALRIGASAKPSRVDLACDGLMSPAHFRAGDVIRSVHALSPLEYRQAQQRGLWIGALRSSGARPDPEDPNAVLAVEPETSKVPP